MSIRGILFDKDGTLLKFQDLWLDAAKSVVRDFIFINKLPDTGAMHTSVLKAMGVEGDSVRADSPLAYMTYEQIGAVVAEKLREQQPEVVMSNELAGRQMSVLFETVLETEQLSCVPTCDLQELFRELRERGIRIGLATADNSPVTVKCLKQLGVETEFDFIGCDDGLLQPKPQPDMFVAFCRQCGLMPEEVAVVGDTVNDMYFAKACGGTAIGTLSGLADREALAGLADYIVDTPAEILMLLEEQAV